MGVSNTNWNCTQTKPQEQQLCPSNRLPVPSNDLSLKPAVVWLLYFCHLAILEISFNGAQHIFPTELPILRLTLMWSFTRTFNQHVFYPLHLILKEASQLISKHMTTLHNRVSANPDTIKTGEQTQHWSELVGQSSTHAKKTTALQVKIITLL